MSTPEDTLREARNKRFQEWLTSPAAQERSSRSLHSIAERAFKAGYEASMLDYALALQLREVARGRITMEEEFVLGPNTQAAVDWAEKNMPDCSVEP